MGSRFTEVIVDCAEPRALAAFWSAVLGWSVTADSNDNEVEITDGEGGPTLLFSRVAEPKRCKNRLHIDVNPVGCEQAEELERLLGLGARPVDIGQGEQTWHVLADPVGQRVLPAAPPRWVSQIASPPAAPQRATHLHGAGLPRSQPLRCRRCA